MVFQVQKCVLKFEEKIYLNDLDILYCCPLWSKDQDPCGGYNHGMETQNIYHGTHSQTKS